MIGGNDHRRFIRSLREAPHHMERVTRLVQLQNQHGRAKVRIRVLFYHVAICDTTQHIVEKNTALVHPGIAVLRRYRLSGLREGDNLGENV